MPSAVSPLVELARVPRRVPRSDVLIAAGLLAWAVLEALLVAGPGSPAVRVLLAAGFTLPLAVRRRAPLAVAGIVVALAVARGAGAGVPEEGAMPLPAIVLATFSAALYARPRWAAWLALPAPALVLVLGGFAGDPNAGSYGFLVLVSAGSWGAGWAIRRRAEQIELARAQGPELAREAVAAERARMARELHNIVAHSVTVISVQAGAAEEALGRAPAQARAHLEAIHRAAREALVELRRLVGVLRGDEPESAPQPGLAHLDELLEQARAAGVAVRLTVEGDHAPLPAAVELAAYRVVQESLTNVRRHAGRAPARVLLRYGDDRLDVEVANAPGTGGALGAGGGRGLSGMRERVRQLGGTLDAGPAGGGGYAVRAGLPLAAGEAVPGEDAVAGLEGIEKLARVPAGIPRSDVVLAGALLAWALVEALLGLVPGDPAVRVPLAVGMTAPLLARRRRPVEVLLAICLLAAATGLLEGEQRGTMPLPALLVASFSAGLYARPKGLAIGLLPLPVVAIVAAVSSGQYDAPIGVDVAVMSVSLVGAWAAGWLIRRRAEQLARERERLPLLAREAVAGERARLARELHDVVAHSVTVTSLQAGAAEGLLERDPARARGHLEAVRGAAHEALVELRRLVGALGEDGAASHAPQPGLDRLDELVAQTQAAGVPVTLERGAVPDDLPAGLALAAYRIVQESLTNVRRHAGPAQTSVAVRCGEDRLELEIVNAPGTAAGALEAGSGRGLIGMRERARLHGGTLDAGPTAAGGFAVRAGLPLAPPAGGTPEAVRG